MHFFLSAVDQWISQFLLPGGTIVAEKCLQNTTFAKKVMAVHKSSAGEDLFTG